MEGFLVANVILLWLVVLGQLFLTMTLVRRVNIKTSSPRSGLEPGSIAPNFTAQTLDEQPVTLSDFRGRSVALIAVGPDCEPCRTGLPDYERVGLIASKVGVKVVLISVGTLEATRKFNQEFRIALETLVATKPDEFMQMYNFTGTPSYCLIEANGEVKASGHPTLEWGEWKRMVENWQNQTITSSTIG